MVNLACDESRDVPTVEAFGDAQTQLTYVSYIIIDDSSDVNDLQVFTITHKCACPGVCSGTITPTGDTPNTSSTIIAIVVTVVLVFT